MASMTKDWVIARASVQGKSHVDGGIVNQDAMALVNPPGDDCFAVAISDGAGSAKRADEGSQHFSREIARGLHKLVSAVHRREVAGNSQNTIADHIQQLITDARKSLNVGDSTLRDFHCNLMALAIGPEWGVMVYLGDAVMLKSAFASSAKGADFFVNASMSLQDRAEYANETHFVTEPDWPKHLVWNFVDPKGQDDFFALMTDGAADIALGPVPGSTEKEVSRPFFAPLVSMVMTAPAEDERNRVIYDALASPQTYKLTGDDKTMVLVIRRSKLVLGALEPIVEKQKPMEKDKIGTPADALLAPVPPPPAPVLPLPVDKPDPAPTEIRETKQVSSAVASAGSAVPQYPTPMPLSNKLKYSLKVVSITVAAVFVVATAAIAGYLFVTRTPKVVDVAEKTRPSTEMVAPIQYANPTQAVPETPAKTDTEAPAQRTSNPVTPAPVIPAISAVSSVAPATASLPAVVDEKKIPANMPNPKAEKAAAIKSAQQSASTPLVVAPVGKLDEKNGELVKGAASPTSASN